MKNLPEERKERIRIKSILLTIEVFSFFGILVQSSLAVSNLSASPQTVPLLIATEPEVRQFFATYIERYNRKDLKGLFSLLSSKVIQNQVDDLGAIKELYTNLFNQSQELKNSVEDMEIQIFQNAVEVKARYTVNQVLKERGEKRVWKGKIRWVLVKEEGILKIISIDFKHSMSPTLVSEGEPKPKEKPPGKAVVRSEIPVEGKKESLQARPLLIKEEEVKQFFSNYIDRYNRKDINGFLSLFSSKAVQNQKEGLDRIRKIYSDFFDQSQEVQYQMEDTKIGIYQNGVEVRARYKLGQRLKSGERMSWRGDIRWTLVKENGGLKILSLDYQHQKTP
jgi:ketosteroid isomerase-like protein